MSDSMRAPRIVTSDIANFWRAFDLAAGVADSAERVRIFRDEYLRPGSPGLRDWARVRLSDQRTVFTALETMGWTRDRATRAYRLPRGDSLRDTLDADMAPLVERSAAEQMARATAAWPRYYAGVRTRTLAIDTAADLTTHVRRGLRRLGELYPEGELRDVYFLIGRLTSGGTVAESGMLLGAELSTRGPATPLDELPETQRAMVSDKTPAELAHLVAHEAVHTLQRGDGGSKTLLEAAIAEGSADFLAELATGVRIDSSVYHRYGRAHERQVWEEFAREMHGTENLQHWLYSWGRATNHGAPDLGYWVGYRIAEAYYTQAADKRAAVRELIVIRDAPGILRASGYGKQ